MTESEVPDSGPDERPRLPRPEPSRIFDVIKRALRARGLTYRDVAEHLGLTESGVKKMFASRDAPWSRVAKLAEIVDVPLAELVRLSEEPAFDEVALTERQQAALLDDPELLATYWKLTVERWSVSRVKRDLGIGDARMRRVLTALDRLDLIRVEAGDRLRIPHLGLVRWMPEGPLLDHLHRAWGTDVLDRAAERPVHDDVLLRLHYLPLRSDTRRELYAQLRAVLDGALRRAEFERLTAPRGSVRAHGLVLAVAPGDFVRPED